MCLDMYLSQGMMFVFGTPLVVIPMLGADKSALRVFFYFFLVFLEVLVVSFFLFVWTFTPFSYNNFPIVIKR